MAVVCSYTINSFKEIAFLGTGFDTDAKGSLYRSADIVAQPGSKVWTESEIIAENVDPVLIGGVQKHQFSCYDAVSNNFYYYKTKLNNADTWYSIGVIDTSSYAEEMKPDYTPAELNVITPQEAYATIQNNSSSQRFASVPLVNNANIAIVCLEKTSGTFTENDLSLQLKKYTGLAKYQLLAIGNAGAVDGSTPNISGYIKLGYEKVSNGQ